MVSSLNGMSVGYLLADNTMEYPTRLDEDGEQDNGVQPEWDVCWIFACRQYHGVPYEVGRKRRTRWPLCFTDIVGLFCKCKKMKQICRLLQLSEMGKRLRQGKDTSRTY
ncbi:uncharacterized protein LOC119324989 isoform X4 [Triticum dicoccoides]|uniref:uncharacterized protein LOC119324989 isoform X4 n=1 Tax=Triticum dicoccoides TaxID=85692 RepID=UPI0018900CF9|nr:uncharacterized protein LOC119324989 isoform X4 [Triticum dicoccoides]